jgi:hypothetical protein
MASFTLSVVGRVASPERVFKTRPLALPVMTRKKIPSVCTYINIIAPKRSVVNKNFVFSVVSVV